MVCAAFAMAIGGRSPAGVFTRSRAQLTDSMTAAAPFTAAFMAFSSQRAPPRTVSFDTPPSAFLER